MDISVVHNRYICNGYGYYIELMNKKKRIPIPPKVAAQIMFESDRTCCVCTSKGKKIQIHHIDDNPANNKLENLAVLCLECHDDTLLKGGFGRKLNAGQIILYKKEWLERVITRKTKADELASIKSVTGSTEHIEYVPPNKHVNSQKEINKRVLNDYLVQILKIKQRKLVEAQTEFDTGITSRMKNASLEVIDFYQEILKELSKFYPKDHFSNEGASNYFSELIASKVRWHRLILEPQGIGTGGTIVSILKFDSVIDELNRMIGDIAATLHLDYDFEDELDFVNWKNQWRE